MLKLPLVLTAVLSFALLGATADPLARYATPEGMVSVEQGRRINLRCGGSGRVTVLLESGLGYPSYSWRKVQYVLEQVTRTCSYDRAGLGFSDPGPMPRTAEAMVKDIEAMVAAKAMRAPLLVVASSLGGQVGRLYAFKHPDQVVGLVLVDPYVEGEFAAFVAVDPSLSAEIEKDDADERMCFAALHRGLTAAEAEKRGCMDAPYAEFSRATTAVIRRQRMSRVSVDTSHSELLELTGANEALLRSARRDLSPRPITVLMATQQFESRALRAPLMRVKRRLMEELAGLSTNGSIREIQSGHVIQSSRPDAVIEAVVDTLKNVTR
jgi:pimeloyl-ACP methyl ester carboxylesterase